ncbi:MAG: hypothetical protein JST85_20835 [Acidobacteria bacterium]|nr:hypothetical protein [Acidobacteriota bacterium]
MMQLSGIGPRYAAKIIPIAKNRGLQTPARHHHRSRLQREAAASECPPDWRKRNRLPQPVEV